MSEQDGHKPPDASDLAGSGPAGPGKEPPRDAALSIQEHIGRELRAMFEDVVAQPVPERLLQLLDELERKQSKG
jgi:hypothetical protein